MLKDKNVYKEEKQQEFLSQTMGYLDWDQQFLPGEMVAKNLDISERSLITFANRGDFELGRVAGKIIVDSKSLFQYLDNHHFVGHDDGTPGLRLVPEHHTTVPVLKPVSEFALRLRMDYRRFLRHCDMGTFYHYRIGTLYKMSEEDWVKSLKRITALKLRSRKGEKGGRKAGRPDQLPVKVAEIQKKPFEEVLAEAKAYELELEEKKKIRKTTKKD